MRRFHSVDRRIPYSTILTESGHPEGKHLDPGVGLAIVPLRTSNPAGGVFRVPRACPGADTFLEMLHNLGGDAAVDVFSFGGVLHRILLHNRLFSLRNPRRFEGVQRSEHVKGAASPRSSQTLDREHRWKNAGFEKARVERRKVRRKTSAK
jgi:hypothetical protein